MLALLAVMAVLEGRIVVERMERRAVSVATSAAPTPRPAPWTPVALERIESPDACPPSPAYAPAALANTASLSAAAWSVFGRPETGWEIYAPLAAHEIGAVCAPDTEAFAAALAAWQGAHRLAPTGVMDPVTLKTMDVIWLRRRPFVLATAHGACPPPPSPDQLAWASPQEGYQTKPIQLRTEMLTAYRQMVADARVHTPALAQDHRLLTIFSGYRDPVDDAARCAVQLNCGTIARANCSAHRTGLAMDIFLGAAPGSRPESSDDANRLYQSRTAAYRWMVANAGRYGFVNYPFEPWHWEWTGDAGEAS
jgi:hypothetical protein